MKTKNRCFDFLKGMACIGVVFIHIIFPGIFGEIIIKAARFAVPLFFMISGYYLWNDNTEAIIQKIPEKIKRLVKLTIISVLIYALYAFIFDRGMYNVNFIRVILIALVINDTSHLFCAWQLWYLIALIYTYIVIFYLLKWNKLSLMRVTVPMLLVLRLALGFSDTYALVFHQSYLFAGIPYVLIGMYVAKLKAEEGISSKYNRVFIVSAILGLLFSFIGIMNVPIKGIGEIGTIVYSVCLFVLGACNGELVINRTIEKIGEKLSLFVYVMHVCIGSVLDNIALWCGSRQEIWYLWTRPVLALLVTLILAEAFVKVKELLAEKY